MTIPHLLNVWFSPPYLYVAMRWWAWLVLLVLLGAPLAREVVSILATWCGLRAVRKSNVAR